MSQETIETLKTQNGGMRFYEFIGNAITILNQYFS